jgi:hypothetical protein
MLHLFIWYPYNLFINSQLLISLEIKRHLQNVHFYPVSSIVTIASMVYTLHWLVIILGIYSLITYHLIIKGEEVFMIKRFSNEYEKYQLKVRRYL